MELRMIHVKLLKLKKLSSTNELIDFEIDSFKIDIYPQSIYDYDGLRLFIGKEKSEKNLFVISDNDSEVFQKFSGEFVAESTKEKFIKKCPLNFRNARVIQELFEFSNPVLIGLSNSFGFGDRLGLANPAHLRSLAGSEFKPILAQQSIREMQRTQRKPEDVLSAAVWAALQEGYEAGFGSDADHLKTTEDIDLMISNGFTMFTFDPGDYVINEADSMTENQLLEKIIELNWQIFNDSYESVLKRYAGVRFEIGDDFVLKPSEAEINRALVKYGEAVIHISNLYNHLIDNYSHLPFEVEISVDETESVTTPFEHFFIASELNRLGVKLVSLAPRFIGDFEKGIDYKGDLEVFKKEYLKHVQIAEYFGAYKISIHSGSDKFGVYNAIGSLHRGFTHVKTAGTSYLEALKVVASTQPDLFREILKFSRDIFDTEKKTYHVSASLDNVPEPDNLTNQELVDLFNQNDARQVLHVTFGKVLTTKKNDNEFLFRTKILKCLMDNEELHYNYIYTHFKNHLDPFKQ
ncbi:MAG: tagaturonate epimerase family protein [Bacteroidetes bacterium]|nr:tagaturonate epimerase family protein [Bacteroidota bacterium]